MNASQRFRERLLDSIPWRGDERVLDVGCGRGLMLIGAARRLTSGRATGIDLWQSEDQSGNRPETTRSNAAAEGVADRVEILTGDARKLPFEPGTFDFVVSSWALHNLYERADDYSSCTYFYLDKPENGLPGLAAFDQRIAGL